MTELHLPWLELCVLVPLLGALWVSRIRDTTVARHHSVVFVTATLILACGAFLDFLSIRASEAQDKFHLTTLLFGRELLQIDEISAPLLPLAALLFALVTIATVRSKARRFSFTSTLLSEAILMATFACSEPWPAEPAPANPWPLIVLLSLGTFPPLFELRARGRAPGMYISYMGLFIVLLAIGAGMVQSEGGKEHSLYAILPLLAAILIRSGIFPFHSWVADLFDRSSFGSALLFVTPLAGVYAAVRLVLPIAPDWVMRSMGIMSLLTAVYAGAMAIVQVEGRRLFSFLFISHAAVILAGLEMATVQGLTGALCVWISVSLSLTGFGLALRAVEARRGRLQLTTYQGLYEQMPLLAACFLLTGLAAVGFPGTMGYVGSELLIDGAVHTYPHMGIAVVIAAALNGIAIVHVYFMLFTGARHISSISLKMGRREKLALLTLVVLLFAGGIAPQLNIASRHHAAEELLKKRGKSVDTQTHAPWESPVEPATAISRRKVDPPLP
jgi:NADH-quinone oxidoreductase subunit M